MKAISPILATVLIIAVTLIGAVTIGGIAFGIWGSSSNAAQVQVTGIGLRANDFQKFVPNNYANITAFTCSNIPSGPSLLTLTNTGIAPTRVLSVSITYSGQITVFGTHDDCMIGAAGQSRDPLYLNFASSSALGTVASKGGAYSGTITLSNGAILIFAGDWI